MEKSNVILIGMPGCGKSYVGLKLSEPLVDYTLIDTDAVIEKTSGMEISEIFKKYSEDYFRKLEYDTIKMVCTGNHKIISVGGGAFENPDNRNTLLKFGTVYYLKSNLDVLYCRISKENTRPLLDNKDKKSVLENLLKKREDNYQKAHHIINTDEMTENEIINFIVRNINESSSTC